MFVPCHVFHVIKKEKEIELQHVLHYSRHSNVEHNSPLLRGRTLITKIEKQHVFTSTQRREALAPFFSLRRVNWVYIN